MALLHFANMEEHRPEVLMQKTFSGLEDFHKFLENTKRYLESEKSVKRLRWELVEDISRSKETSQGIWVQLIEAESSSDDVTFKHFLDENNKEVYEANNANWKYVASPATDCPTCKQKNKKPKLAYQTKEHAEEVASQSKTQLGIYECENGHGWHLTKQFRDGQISFAKENKLVVLDRNINNEQLLLDRIPDEEYLVLRPNTYTLKCQLNAIKELQDSPNSTHRPLLRLFESSDHAKWARLTKPRSNPFYDMQLTHYEHNGLVAEWHVLTDISRPGTQEQRDFVEIALNTPDFAFLEGPPGSGKTTAILELIIQLALRGKRILLCASTHVAVDNVLERILEEDNEIKDLIIALRMGDKSNISEKVKPNQLEEFLQTERNRLLASLNKQSNLSEAQALLLEQLRSRKNNTIQRMVLESANLICGTTIGILQHPDIKSRGEANPQFDYMIIDEASKTTFQEFLVPALLAKRWVLVGDQKQLSPYVDDESTAINIEPCLPEQYKRNACIDVFQASSYLPSSKRINSLILTKNQQEVEFYQAQAEQSGVLLASPRHNIDHLPYASIVTADELFVGNNEKQLPYDFSRIRGSLDTTHIQTQYRNNAFLAADKKRTNNAKWEDEIAWRLSRLYEQRHNNVANDETKKNTAVKLQEQIKALLPHNSNSGSNSALENINRVRRVALPSVLESLQSGFERKTRQRQGTALSDGLPEIVFQQRAVTLSYQHRMHPDIAEFSARVIYNGKALKSPDFMEEKRHWDYRPERSRSIWLDVRGKVNSKTNSNKIEADQVLNELQAFDRWAKANPKEDGKPWEVAVLSFYRGQERELKFKIRSWTGNRQAHRHFKRGDKKTPYLDIQLCTVDRFQGHEADLVLLSFMNNYPTSFLESPNRLNVAITRARYGLVVFGNRNPMARASGVLATFAQDSAWSKTI